MAEGGIAYDAAVEFEGRQGLRGSEEGAARGVSQFRAAAPQLKGEVVESVVAVREGGEDGAVAARSWVSEEAGGLLEVFPGGGRNEFAEELRAESIACSGVLKQVSPVNKAFGAVVPRKRGEMAIQDQGLNKRVRPSIGPVVERNALVPGAEVFEGSGGVRLGYPVGDEEGEIEVSVVEAAIGDGRLMQFVNADGNEFDGCAGVVRFEEMRFFLESVLEVCVVAENDP